MLRLTALFLALFSVTAFAQTDIPSNSRLKTIANTKTIKIAYRTDARPFSFVNEKNEPVGFTIDLCKLVVNSIERQSGVRKPQDRVGAGDCSNALYDRGGWQG